MKIFITGASGFVGLSLIEDLLKEKHEVYGLVRREEAVEKLKNAGATPFRGDLTNTRGFSQALNGMDVLIHLGALIKFSGNFDIFYKINVVATKLLINHAIEQGIRKFIYVSAAGIALNGTDLFEITEEFEPAKMIDSNYLKSKVLAEKEILERKDEIQTIILRPPVIWGQGMRIIEDFRPTIKRMGFPTFGNIHHHLATCHVKNLCAAILRSLKSDQAEGIYLIGDGEKVVTKKFMSELLKGYGLDMGSIHLPKNLALVMAGILEFIWKLFQLNGDPPITTIIVHLMGTEFTIDDSRIRNELGYNDVISVECGLKQLNRIQEVVNMP